MTDTPRDADRDVSVTALADSAKRSPLDYVAVALVLAAGLLLVAGVIYAFAVADARNVDGSERFRLLAQAASPFVAGLALAAIALVAHERRRARPAQVSPSAVLAGGSMVALLALLLALNGIVVDLTAEVGAMFKLSNIVGRLATVALAGIALWLSAATPMRPLAGADAVVARPDRPVHS